MNHRAYKLSLRFSQAHVQLRDQLVWITKHMDEVSQDIAEIQRRQQAAFGLGQSNDGFRDEEGRQI